MYKYHPPFNTVLQVKIYFHTQKSTSIYQIKTIKPAIIGRTNSRESEFLERLLLWCVWNRNDLSDEFFTRRIRDGPRKKLLRVDVTAAIHSIATRYGFDTHRFGTHSLRRGFATASEYQTSMITKSSSLHTRAGWSIKSTCPKNIYSQARFNGAISYNFDVFTIEHVKELIDSL